MNGLQDYTLSVLPDINNIICMCYIGLVCIHLFLIIYFYLS